MLLIYLNTVITAITFSRNQNATNKLILKAHFRYLHVKHEKLYTRPY